MQKKKKTFSQIKFKKTKPLTIPSHRLLRPSLHQAARAWLHYKHIPGQTGLFSSCLDLLQPRALESGIPISKAGGNDLKGQIHFSYLTHWAGYQYYCFQPVALFLDTILVFFFSCVFRQICRVESIKPKKKKKSLKVW